MLLVRRIPILLVLWLAGVLAVRASAGDRFELVPLGVFGGEVESNGTCFLLGHASQAGRRLMIDGGSPVSGILRWKGLDAATGGHWGRRMEAVRGELARVDAFLFTHGHLDHTSGFILSTPLFLDGALKGRTAELYGGADTLAALRDKLLRPPLWGDFTKVPSPEHPVVRLHELVPEQEVRLAGFRVCSLPLRHPVTSVAYLVEEPGGDAVVVCGDTGPTAAIWSTLRPRLLAGKPPPGRPPAGSLRAIAIECSFDSSQGGLAEATGHLTPLLLVRQLVLLAFGAGEAPPVDLAAALAMAPRLGKALRSVRVLVHHIKPSSYDRVAAELEQLRQAGLPLELLRQGLPVRL